MNDHVLTNFNAAVLTITLNRPEKKNALTQAMYAQLAEVIRDARLDAEVRVILLRGSESCFTSGNDLTEFQAPDFAESDSPVLAFLKTVYECEKPIVAAVAGDAVGVGTTLLLHCDLVYAAQNCRFQLPFVNLGLTPEFASSYLLPLLAGHCKAAEWLLLGEPFGVDDAEKSGLVNRVVTVPELFQVADKAAERLAAKPPRAVRQTKALMRRFSYERGLAVMAEEADTFQAGLASPEFAEALQAFLEKRPADFSSFN